MKRRIRVDLSHQQDLFITYIRPLIHSDALQTTVMMETVGLRDHISWEVVTVYVTTLNLKHKN